MQIMLWNEQHFKFYFNIWQLSYDKILYELEIKYILATIFNRRSYIRINLKVNLNKEK